MKPTFRPAAIFLSALLGLLLLAGCSNVQPRVAEPHKVLLDQRVNTSRLAVYARPGEAPRQELSLLFTPMVLRVDINNPRLIGRQVTQSVWQAWTRMEVLGTQEYDESIYYHDRQSLARAARRKGADLVASGEITHFIDGGRGGDSAVAFRLDIFDAVTGQMLWSMAQSGRMEAVMTEDYIFFKREYRLPEKPVHAVITRIAETMGLEVRDWARTHGDLRNMPSQSERQPAGEQSAPPPPPPARGEEPAK